MRLLTLSSLLLTFLLSLATCLETDRQIDIHTWPLTSPKSASYSKLTYNSTHAIIKTHNNPAIPPNDEIVRLGFYNPAGSWTGVATAAANFGAEKDKKMLLYVDSDGVVYHVGFKASSGLGTSSTTSDKKDDLSVEVVRPLAGPIPHLNRPVVVNADGSAAEEEKVEKTFLQKYWWAIAGFVLLQVVLSGGKGE